ncbi:hypothetical protein [Rhizobacter sp. Root1221]|uniref:hypothetical protein n=1 Tax=Rhizobacter sp. Root1221 TaxID=1736433 RepID=UPI0006F8A505|nr:hypothetical protein [Rhizobacter sp. Root1221]KQW02509.1 hypothetical protein ASC87_12345 [Rhizobacter sp. Root1221]
MVIFSWVVLGLAGLLLLFSGLSWGIFIANEDSDWRRLAVKVFRFSMVLVLLFVNVMIYAHIVSGLGGT